VAKMAANLDRDYFGKDPLFLAVLNGAFIFASDLFKMIQMPANISFIKLASYSGTKTTGNVSKLIGLSESITDRHVIILEDIIDTGISMEFVLNGLKDEQPASLKIASLLFKPDAFKGAYKIDYIGLSIPNDFIVGYGLDYNGFGRNLKDIYSLK